MGGKRVLLTIKEAATRRGWHRRVIERAIRSGKLPSTGHHKTRRVKRVDVDKLPPYKPQKRRPDYVAEEIIYMQFTEEDALIMSYCLTKMKGLGKLEGVEPQRIQAMQVRFAAIGPPGYADAEDDPQS